MAQAQYKAAPEVREIAENLIPKYHQHLVDFDVKLEYVFIDKTPKSKNSEVWGTCRKVSSLNAFLGNGQDGSDPFFVITISEPVWDVLPHDKRVALVDHELCHAWAEASQKEDSDGSEDVVKLSVKTHDLEEFCCVVRRHGFWRESIEYFVKSAINTSKQ
jgi:predicted metallopeptidase